jgi:hypothetical protein
LIAIDSTNPNRGGNIADGINVVHISVAQTDGFQREDILMLKKREDGFVGDVAAGDRSGVKKKMLIARSAEYNGLPVADRKAGDIDAISVFYF